MGQRNNTEIPINKNCDIIMCRDKTNRQDENVLERKVLSDLCNIFTRHPHLKDKGVRIGIQSSNAFAYILNGFHENRIVIKIPKNGKVDSLKYEYFIGCDIRKRLYKKIPNFMKMYGYIRKNNNEYLIIERVLPGITLRELTKPNDKCAPMYNSIKTEGLKSLVLQVLCAIQTAQNLIGFVHYDLHFGNILIKKIHNAPEFIHYRYKHRNGVCTVNVPIVDNNIAVIIDYGRSHTSKSTKFFTKNPKLFKTYEWLTDKKRSKNVVDIRQFDRLYDTKKFCRILANYIHDFKFNDKNIKEPHDIVVQLVNKKVNL